jgi:hypothetical protein
MTKNGILHGLVGSLLLLSIVGVIFLPGLAALPAVGALVAPAPTVTLDA